MARMITRLAALAAFLISISAVSGIAQDRRQNEPGQFDFYVLSLAWSPSFCDAATERSADRAAREPHGGERPDSFGGHGLGPQDHRGFPEYSPNPAPRPEPKRVSSPLQ